MSQGGVFGRESSIWKVWREWTAPSLTLTFTSYGTQTVSTMGTTQGEFAQFLIDQNFPVFRLITSVDMISYVANPAPPNKEVGPCRITMNVLGTTEVSFVSIDTAYIVLPLSFPLKRTAEFMPISALQSSSNEYLKINYRGMGNFYAYSLATTNTAVIFQPIISAGKASYTLTYTFTNLSVGILYEA